MPTVVTRHRRTLLTDSRGHRHLVSAPRAHGASAQLRYGLHASGRAAAFKELHGAAPAVRALALHEWDVMRAVQARYQPIDLVQAGSRVFLVLPLMAGDMQAVSQKLRRERARVGRAFLRSLSQELAQVHHAGFVHRDIKLANVLLTPEGGMLLADYGLAQPLNKLASVACAGTLSHLAPEVLRQGRVSTASDVWSLGIAYADLLVGPSPFAATGAALHHNLRTYPHWHAALPRRPRGGLDWQALAEDAGNPWSTYFVRLARRDRRMAALLLQRLLHPNPRLRPSAQEIADLLNGVQAPVSAPELRARQVLQEVAASMRFFQPRRSAAG